MNIDSVKLFHTEIANINNREILERKKISGIIFIILVIMICVWYMIYGYKSSGNTSEYGIILLTSVAAYGFHFIHLNEAIIKVKLDELGSVNGFHAILSNKEIMSCIKKHTDKNLHVNIRYLLDDLNYIISEHEKEKMISKYIKKGH